MLPLILLLASCATLDGRAIEPDRCAGWVPIIVSSRDVLTDGTARAILAHDEFGARMGCWKAPTRKSEKPDSAKPADAAH